MKKKKTQTGMTALAGLPIYLDMTKVIGLSKSIQKHLKGKENSQGAGLIPNKYMNKACTENLIIPVCHWITAPKYT